MLHRATKTLLVLQRTVWPVFSYYNVNKARIQGVETELKIPFNDEWKSVTQLHLQRWS